MAHTNIWHMQVYDARNWPPHVDLVLGTQSARFTAVLPTDQIIFLQRINSGTARVHKGESRSYLDDSPSHRLLPAPDDKPPDGGRLAEVLDTHGPGGHQLGHGDCTRLHKLVVVFWYDGPSSPWFLRAEGGTGIRTDNSFRHPKLYLAGDMGSVTAENKAVAIWDLSGVVEDYDLSGEVSCLWSGIDLGDRGHKSTINMYHVRTVSQVTVQYQNS